MNVDLSKCKSGDKFILRNGNIVKFKCYSSNRNEQYDYVKTAHFCDELYRTLDGKCPFMDTKLDIISKVDVKKIKRRNNIVKYSIYKIYGKWVVQIIIDNWIFDLHEYSSKKSAINGVIRFCKRIGFTYKQVEK